MKIAIAADLFLSFPRRREPIPFLCATEAQLSFQRKLESIPFLCAADVLICRLTLRLHTGSGRVNN